MPIRISEVVSVIFRIIRANGTLSTSKMRKESLDFLTNKGLFGNGFPRTQRFENCMTSTCLYRKVRLFLSRGTKFVSEGINASRAMKKSLVGNDAKKDHLWAMTPTETA